MSNSGFERKKSTAMDMGDGLVRYSIEIRPPSPEPVESTTTSAATATTGAMDAMGTMETTDEGMAGGTSQAAQTLTAEEKMVQRMALPLAVHASVELVYEHDNAIALQSRTAAGGQKYFDRPARFKTPATDGETDELLPYDAKEVQKKPGCNQALFWIDSALDREIQIYNTHSKHPELDTWFKLFEVGFPFKFPFPDTRFVFSEFDILAPVRVRFDSPLQLRLLDLMIKANGHLTAPGVAFQHLVSAEDAKSMDGPLHACVLSSKIVDYVTSHAEATGTLEAALATTVWRDDGEGRSSGSQRFLELPRPDCGRRQVISSASGRGSKPTRAVLLRNKDPECMTDDEKCLSESDLTKLSDPWLSRSVYMNFPELRSQVAKHHVAWDNQGELLQIAAPADREAIRLQKGQTLLWLIFDQARVLVPKTSDYIKSHSDRLLPIAKTKGFNQGLMPLSVVKDAMGTVDKVWLFVHKSTLLSIIDQLEFGSRKANLLHNLSTTRLNVTIPTENGDEAIALQNRISKDRDDTDADPAVRYYVEVDITLALPPPEHKEVLAQATPPVIDRVWEAANPHISLSRVLTSDHNVKLETPEAVTRYFREAIRHTGSGYRRMTTHRERL